MNKPVTRQEMITFKEDKLQNRIGGKTFLGYNDKNEPTFYPNHQERRKWRKTKSHTGLNNTRKATRGRIKVVLHYLSGKIKSIITSKPYNQLKN